MTPFPIICEFSITSSAPGYNFPSRYFSHWTEYPLYRFIEDRCIEDTCIEDAPQVLLVEGPRQCFSFCHTSSFPPALVARVGRGRQRRAGRPRSLLCVQCLLFRSLFSKARDKWSRTCRAPWDRSLFGYFLLCLFDCSVVSVVLGSIYSTIPSGPVL